ncbi:hypothetical protein D3C87_1543530 [compost metagenome]
MKIAHLTIVLVRCLVYVVMETLERYNYRMEIQYGYNLEKMEKHSLLSGWILKDLRRPGRAIYHTPGRINLLHATRENTTIG